MTLPKILTKFWLFLTSQNLVALLITFLGIGIQVIDNLLTISERNPARFPDWEAVAVPHDPALRQPERSHGHGQSDAVAGEPQRRRTELPGAHGTDARTQVRDGGRSFGQPAHPVHPQSRIVDVVDRHQQQPLPRLLRPAAGRLLRSHHPAGEGAPAMSGRPGARIVLPPIRLRQSGPVPERTRGSRLRHRRWRPQISGNHHRFPGII